MDALPLLMEVHLLAPSVATAVAGLLACTSLFVEWFASCSEAAFTSLSPGNIDELEEEKTEADHRIKWLLGDQERTLATIIITKNLAIVAFIILFNFFFANVIDCGGCDWLRSLSIIVLLALLLLFFGEIAPKLCGTHHPLAFCRRTADGVTFCRTLFHPFSSALVRTGVLAGKVMRKESHVISVDDLEQALELTDNAEVNGEKKMLEGIVHFGDETAKEVMTSRQDIVDLDFKSAFPDVLKCIVDNNYSRIPVYRGNVDKICGILYIKDLLPHLLKPANFRWQSLIRPPYFVPETKKIDDLLREFQENKVHIAVVVDEFGGTSGIVTLEDILEEIVGEINDEYDDDVKSYVRIAAGTFVFEGKTLLSDFTRIMNIDSDAFDDIGGDVDTLAGLLLELKGDFPSPHEKLECKGLDFEVLEMDEWRIVKVKVATKRENDEGNTDGHK